MKRSICVYCSSSDAVASVYKEQAEYLGKLIGSRGDRLVFGGGDVGLMGILAHSVKEHGGEVLSIIPKKIHQLGIVFADSDEIIISNDLRDRKGLMDEKADSFVALPGGIGTAEEILEILSLKYLRYHARPVAFINTEGFYESLLRFLERMYADNFAKPAVKNLYHVMESCNELYPYLENYKEPEIGHKWFRQMGDK